MRNALLSGFRHLRAHPLALLALLLASRASFAQTTAYCNTGLGGFCGSNEVSAVSISNTTLNATGLVCTSSGTPAQAYTSYPATGSTTATLSGGVPYTLGVTMSTASIVSVWIDFNHNFMYEASEWTQVATNSAVGTPTTVSITVPSGAVQGQTGMRIRSRGTGNANGATDGCTSFGSGETKDFTLTIGAPAACPAVTGPGATNITATGATVNFTPATGVVSYTVTATPTTGTPVTQTGTTSPIALTGLTASTVYAVSIVSNCGASGTSAAATFSLKSGCAAPAYTAVTSTTSYAQDFESAWQSLCATNDAPSANWLNTPATGNASWRRNDDGASAAWTSPMVGAYTPTGSSGTYSARFHSYYAGANALGTLDLYVNLSATGNKVLQFDYLNTAGNDSLQVQVSTDGGTTFGAPLLRLGMSGTVAQGWQPQSVSITSTSATTVVRFRGKVTATFTSDIGLDNLRLGILSGVPGCATNLSPANGATGVVRSPTITFGNSSGVATGYDVYFGTTATPPLVSSNQQGQSYTPAGLAATTTYYYQIVPRNANGPATGCSVSSFTTTSTFVYCNTNLGNYCGTADVTNVTVGGSGLNNTSTVCNSSNNSSYTSYPATGTATGTLLQGLSYPVSVTTAAAAIISVWIDFNQNGTFEASEWTQVATTSTANQPSTVSVLVPATALLGQTGLRIRSRSNGSPNGAGDACSTFGSGEAEDYIVTIGAAPSCAPANGLAVSNLSTTSATLTFSAGNGTATNYVVQYGPAGFNPAQPSSGTNTYTTVNTTSLSVPIIGLTANTSYQFYVTKSCGAGQTSQTAGPFTFSTMCLPPVYVTLPYTQDFESAWVDGCNTRDIPSTNWLNTPPTGNTSWRREDDGASAAWSGPTSGAFTPAGSPLGGATSLHSARFHSYNVTGRGVGTLDLYANLSSGTGTPTLSFDYINTSGTDSVRVQLSTNGGSTFTTIAGSGVGIATAWTRRTVNLPTTGLTANSVIRLRAVGDFGITDIGIDNVQLAFITCPAVTGASVTGITATGATLSFTPSSGSSNYTITVTPATGTPITQTATASPVTLTGLTGSTSYTVSIVGNCGASGTSLPALVTFQTSCIAPPYVVVNSTTPYSQNFETAWLSRCNTNDAPGVNWLNTPLTGNTSWRREDDGASAAWSGPTSGAFTPAGSPLGGATSLHSARFHSYNVTGRGVGTLDLYANLSSGTGTPTLSFDYINTSGTDSVRVQLSTNGGSTFTDVAGSGVGIATAWTRRTVNLPTTGLTATTVIRLRAVGDFGVTDIGIDNVQLAFITCPAVTGLTITANTATSVSLSFTPVAGAASYTVTLTPATGTPTTQTVTASPVALTGLTAGASYTVSVVSSCGTSGTSQPAVITFVVPPVNDECAGAVDVPVQFGTACVSQTTGDNTAATTSTGVPALTCSATTLNRDIWFKVTVPASGVVTVKTVAPTGSSNITDTVISMYSGTCGNLTEIGCNDDTNGLYSQVALTGRTPGEVLYIRAWSYSATNSGLIAVCVTTPSNCPAPLGPTATNVTNTTARLNWVAPSNAPTGATYEIEYGLQGFTQGNGTTVTGLTGLTYQLTNLTPNSDYCYYVRLNCGATNGSSTYVGPTCFSTPLTVPGNDNPCGAITLGATSVNGSTSGATTSAQAGIPLPTCSSAQLPKDVWFAFTATAATYRLTVTGTAAGLVRVFTSPDCTAGPFNQIGCFAGAGANQNVGPVNLSGLAVGTRYYVAVSGYSSSDTPGNFTILGVVTATKAQADTDALLVYPNPSNTGQLTLRLSNVSKAGQATLLNALGQVVATRNLNATAEQTLNTRGLATGVYTLRVTVAGQVLTRKVVLE